MTTAKSFHVTGIQSNTETPVTQDVTIASNRRLLPRDLREAGADAMVVQADEVVRVEFNNGFVLWTRANDLFDEHCTQRKTHKVWLG